MKRFICNFFYLCVVYSSIFCSLQNDFRFFGGFDVICELWKMVGSNSTVWEFTWRNGPIRALWRVSCLHLFLQQLRLKEWVGTLHQCKTLYGHLLLELFRLLQHPHLHLMKIRRLCSWMHRHHRPNFHPLLHHVLLVGHQSFRLSSNELLKQIHLLFYIKLTCIAYHHKTHLDNLPPLD